MSMRSSVKAAIGLAIVLGTSAVGVWQAGCSSSGDSPSAVPVSGGGAPGSGSNGTGQVSIALTLAGGDVINSVTWTLENSSGAIIPLGTTNPGTVNTSTSLSINFQIGGIPAGTGDQIILSATTTQGETCTGTATGITITARATASVAVQMLCTAPAPDAGNLAVTGTASYCGTWTSLATGATGSEVFVGETITLNAAATGDNPNNLGYTWTMSNPIGVFGAIQPTGGVGTPGQDEAVGPSDPMTFLCTSAGTTTVTLVVDDGPTDAGVCPASLSTTTATVTCDPYPANQVESAWVELTGPNGINGLTGNVAIARALTAYVPTGAGANPCPTITINGGTPVQMNLRAAATTSIPSRTVNTAPGIAAAAIIGGAAAGGPGKPALFPVSSCEYPLPSGTTSALVAGLPLPLPKANPTRIVIIGDTGCRLQTDNGTQSCNDPNPEGTDTPYPFAAIAALAAAQNPDLVIHVGDYAYRDNECPAGLGFNCGGSPWGFGWDAWEVDLFVPGAPLLAAAPWIMTRGNHEQCNRAGQGWYRFLDTQPFDTAGVHTCDNPAYDDPGPLSSSTTADTTCANYNVYGNCTGNWNNPFLVQINSSTQIVVFDTANAKPQSQAVNPSFPPLPTGSTSLPTGSTSLFFATYASELTTAGNLVGASPLSFNFWSNHHPIFGYATATAPALPTDPIPAFYPVMKSVFGTYFPPPINLALHGHTHDYQAINFQTGTLPDGGTFQPAATLVSGNAGDILDLALPYPLTGSAVSAVGNPTAVSVATTDAGVQQFASSDNGAPYWNAISDAAVAAGDTPTDSDFGYMVLQFNAGPPATWTSTEYRADNTVRDVCIIQTTGQMSCASWGIVLQDSNGVY
jgi:Calcineurin-like phosphoesterase